jgi:Na+/serine symporter
MVRSSLKSCSEEIGEEEMEPPAKKIIGIMVLGDFITAINHLLTTFLFNEIIKSLHQKINSRPKGVMQLFR